MRTEKEIRQKLAAKRAAQKHALENKMVWSISGLGYEIKELEWVLS